MLAVARGDTSTPDHVSSKLSVQVRDKWEYAHPQCIHMAFVVEERHVASRGSIPFQPTGIIHSITGYAAHGWLAQ